MPYDPLAPLPPMLAVAELDTIVTTVQELMVNSGILQTATASTTKALGLGATEDVTFTWDRPFPNASYLAVREADVTGILPNVIAPWVGQTAATITYRVQSQGVVAAGVKLRCQALWVGPRNW